jgi:hypothetical protein
MTSTAVMRDVRRCFRDRRHLTREPEADALADVLELVRSPVTSPIAIFQAALGICRKRHASVEEAEEDVSEFLRVAGVRASRSPKGRRRRRSSHSPDVERGGAIRHSSISAIASPTRSRKPIGRHYCSKARISTRPTSRPQLARDLPSPAFYPPRVFSPNMPSRLIPSNPATL